MHNLRTYSFEFQVLLPTNMSPSTVAVVAEYFHLPALQAKLLAKMTAPIPPPKLVFLVIVGPRPGTSTGYEVLGLKGLEEVDPDLANKLKQNGNWVDRTPALCYSSPLDAINILTIGGFRLSKPFTMVGSFETIASRTY